MTSLPQVFEMGLWHAWILILPQFLIFILVRIAIFRNRNGGEIARLNKERRLLTVLTATVLALYVYPIFLPLRLDTVWFFAGFFIYLLGLVFATVAALIFVTTPKGRPVTKGVYRVSRNPLYFGSFLVYIGVGVACFSLIYLLLAVAYIVLQHVSVHSEERFCLEKYGSTYREYLNETPKWIGIPKSRNRRR